METLKPQDVVVVLKICADAARRRADPGLLLPSLALLGIEVGLSASEVHAAIRRSRASGLLRPDFSASESNAAFAPAFTAPRSKAASRQWPNTTAILEFFVHGLKYVFPAKRGELTRGVPTSYAAPPLAQFIAQGSEPIPVWPFAEGAERGVAFEPLYRTVPTAALRDPALYELLAIADALREGRARERKIAEEQLRERLGRFDVG